MELVTLPKTEYRKLIKAQEEMRKQLGRLTERVDVLSDDVISSVVQKKLDKLSRSMEKGSGKRFSSITAFKSYVASLS
jgi:hypothetical protein